MSDALERRRQKRDLAKAERHRIRTTRTLTIPVPRDRVADLFAAIAARDDHFRYRITGSASMRAWMAGWGVEAAAAAIGGFLPGSGPAVDLRFADADDGATLITATVPEIAYVFGNGHLLGIQTLFTFIEEGAERWNAASS
jgi:uncharacterized membrane protein YbhN (UPF0104 family)